ncbi:DUF6602 domain-containing protein [Ferrimonas sp. YFM]|uniref:DUF6602 domain-containing protein n=1 Tax=Ferrimonas sp. YFM TaxID=3028878 RepID=UPI0025730B47|nr:DUF6602 domain-containing protein [Ferrimonas sp. YFM]BDY05268.1 hypothetical protein F0521_23090 [Ferrimonas sp. YFM]
MEERYYTAGWKKFELNRRGMLAQYDLAKFENENRPLQTEHGVIAESTLRNWLIECLPEEYGVTSGFIIPPIVEPSDYTEYHFDVIIYEKKGCPVLWQSHNSDLASQGQHKAIPLRYVRCVLEVKAAFNAKNAKSARDGLERLRNIGSRFSSGFKTAVVFFESQLSKRNSITPLAKLVGETGDRLFDFGCVLRCDKNFEVSGFFEKVGNMQSPPLRSEKLYNDIDNYVLEKQADSSISPNTTPPSFSILDIRKDGRNTQHFFKSFNTTYLSPIHDRFDGYSLKWSRNGFTYFILHLLYVLANKPSIVNGDLTEYPPGLCFDKCTESL